MSIEEVDAEQTPVRSDREVLSHDLAQWLRLWITAPETVVEKLQPAEGRAGFARRIEFGRNDGHSTLDIWSSKRLELVEAVGTDRAFHKRFDSEVAFTDYCAEFLGAPAYSTTGEL